MPKELTQEKLQKRAIKSEIARLKYKLHITDYIVLKIAEAETEEEKAAIREEYAEVIANRIAWREEINELEGELE